jgi:hypothetical protein
LNEILDLLDIPDLTIKIDNNFVICDTGFVSTKKIFNYVEKWIKDKDIYKIYSFFFALTLAYGDLVIK